MHEIHFIQPPYSPMLLSKVWDYKDANAVAQDFFDLVPDWKGSILIHQIVKGDRKFMLGYCWVRDGKKTMRPTLFQGL